MVDPKKPGITITSPTEETLTNNPTLTVSGNITNATSANLTLNRTIYPVTVTGGGFTKSVTLSEGVNVIVVNAYTTGYTGDSDYLNTSGVRMVTLDTTAPVVTIETPTSGSAVNTPLRQVSGTVNDPGVTTVLLTLNGAPQSVTVSGGRFSKNVTLAPGTNTITVRATDGAGNTSPASPVTITLDTSKPLVTITTPANKLLTNTAGQTVSGTVSDPSITTVTLYLRGSAEAISVSPDGGFNKMVTLTTGANTIEVRATDTAGNTGTSGEVSATLDNTAPVVTIGLIDPKDSITITVTSNETLTATPTVSVNATAITMTQADVNKWTGVYGSVASPIVAGTYTVTANATDKAGNKTTKTATFTKKKITVNGVDPTTVTTATTTLNVETNGAVSDADISLTSSLENPSGNVGNPEGATAGVGAFVEIVASSELRDNLKQIYIRVDYDEDDLPEGTVESTLRLYLWDMDTGMWQLVPDSGVNTDENYIYGTVTHLSQYGGFGTIVVTPTTPTVTPTPSPPLTLTDTVPPRLSSISAEDVTKTSAIIKWRTNEESTSQVEYWSSPSELSPLDETLVFFHEVRLTDLNPATTYHYKTMSKYDTGNLAVSGEYTVTTLGTPAAVTTSVLTISPTKVNIGESITISVTVTNTGDATGSHEVTLKIDNKVVATEEVTLASGASVEVTFTTSRDIAGTYTINVNGLSGTFTVSEVLLPPPPVPAAFATSDLTISPTEVDAGEAITISVTVANTGELSGSYTVTLTINNVVTDTKEVTLAGGASVEVTFTTSRDAAGTYTVNVNGLPGTFVVRELVLPPKPTINWWLIGGLIAAFIAIVVIIVLIFRRVRAY